MHIDTFHAMLHAKLIGEHAYPVKQLAAEMGVSPKTLYHKLKGDNPLYFDEALAIVRITQLPALQRYVIEQAGLAAAGKLRAVGCGDE